MLARSNFSWVLQAFATLLWIWPGHVEVRGSSGTCESSYTEPGIFLWASCRFHHFSSFRGSLSWFLRPKGWHDFCGHCTLVGHGFLTGTYFWHTPLGKTKKKKKKKCFTRSSTIHLLFVLFSSSQALLLQFCRVDLCNPQRLGWRPSLEETGLGFTFRFLDINNSKGYWSHPHFKCL